MDSVELCSTEDYIALVSDETSDEFRVLVDELTNQETQFFRNRPKFELLRSTILPTLIRQKTARRDKRIRIWSAGCSTGEEPISILISLLESISYPKTWDIRVMGTDISTKALLASRKGQYSEREFSIVDSALRDRYFEMDSLAGIYTLKDNYRQYLDFRYHNLKSDEFLADVDIIFCCNVMIYFKNDIKAEIYDRFHNALLPGGYLFIGHSETMNRIYDQFETLYFEDAIAYRKRSSEVAEGSDE
jgi:chemotaxis protein methyltransferase CheR